ncbi:MAG: type III pantothenate kinase [Bacteroidales bacterium]|jgi:type III pantothenate kinase|nr:type III pantothenate kinase [Bacteroidales bacterium]
MNLIIDIGNTRTKLATFCNNKITDIYTAESNAIEDINNYIESKNYINCIISSVKKSNIDSFSIKDINTIVFNHKTPIPVKNCYKTPETLGLDRLAAVIGATELYPGKDIMVIDSGTAITYDFIDRNRNYLGGNISPGIQIRYKALNCFTDNLPLLSKQDSDIGVGKTTESAIVNGVQNGIVFEIEGYINHFNGKNEDLTTIITGGDALFFDKIIKNNIFVNQNLVLIGLNRILNHNVEN